MSGLGPQEIAADRVLRVTMSSIFLGLDIYDYKYEGWVGDSWSALHEGIVWPGIAQRLRRPARRADEFPEWGVGDFGDNPFFIQQMHDWFVKNKRNITYAAYFDVNGLWPTQIDKRSSFLNLKSSSGSFPTQILKRFRDSAEVTWWPTSR